MSIIYLFTIYQLSECLGTYILKMFTFTWVLKHFIINYLILHTKEIPDKIADKKTPKNMRNMLEVP